jgi:hypothetical protein
MQGWLRIDWLINANNRYRYEMKQYFPGNFVTSHWYWVLVSIPRYRLCPCEKAMWDFLFSLFHRCKIGFAHVRKPCEITRIHHEYRYPCRIREIYPSPWPKYSTLYIQWNFSKLTSTGTKIIGRFRGVAGFVRLHLQRIVKQGLKKSADIQGGTIFWGCSLEKFHCSLRRK